MYLLRVGERDVPRSLQAMLREEHERLRETVASEIRVRKENGVPLDETRPWPEALSEALDGIDAVEDRAEARKRIVRALTALEGGGLEEVPPYEPDPDLEGVEVVLRAVRKADLDAAEVAFAGLREERAAAIERGTSRQETADIEQRHAEVAARLVAIGVAEIRGLEGPSGPFTIEADGDQPLSDADVASLHSGGLLAPLHVAVRGFNRLGPAEKKAFGQPRAKTSESTAATAAPSTSEPPADATGQPPAATGEGTTTTSTTAAPGATFSIVPGSPQPSPGTGPSQRAEAGGG